MSFTNWETTLCHWGVSKDNGAPGVGTGNWRRGGSAHKHSGRFPIGRKSVKSTVDDINSVREYLKEQAGVYHKRQEKAEKKYKKVLSRNEKRAAKAAAKIERAKKFIDDNRFMQLKFESMGIDDKLTEAGKKRYLKTKTITVDELNKKDRKKVARLLRSRNPQKQEAAYKLLNQLNPDGLKKEDIDTTLYGKKEKEKGQIAGLGLGRSIRKQARSMTEQELNDAIKRIDLEKKYSDLMKQQNKTIVSTGAEVVGNMFRRSFENIGQQLLTYGIGTAVNKVAKKEVVNPKKGQKDK